jgi:ATP-dependent DNA helicase RecG
MLDPVSGEARVLGLLVVGLDPSAAMPGAYIQFVRYEGVDQASNVIDQEELRGNLIGQLDILARILTANIRTAIREVGGLRQEDHPDYRCAPGAGARPQRRHPSRLRTLQRAGSRALVATQRWPPP